MATAPTRVLKQGRITIPADVRQELGLSPGDYVVVDIQPFDGGDPDD